MRRVLFAFTLAVTLGACSTERPAESEEFRAALPSEAVEREDPTTSPFGEIEYDDPDGILSVLALSGGGAYGAYGVGVLSGWTESGERPVFDIVTGVSTGALISVFAFLGEDYDELLRDLYTNTTNADIFIDKGVSGLLTDSLYDYTPLKDQIERVITYDVLGRIADEHAKGRRLFVATTNLDSSELVVWDMGAIASGGRSDPMLHFQKVLRASAAVPVFFQPVYIKPQRGIQLRQAHVDGGVKAPILVEDFMFRSNAAEKRLYVIVNDSLVESSASAPVEPTIQSIASKTVTALLRSSVVEALYRSYVRSVVAEADFFLAYVPDEFNDSVGSLDFNPVVMQSLFEAGRNSALSGFGWNTLPPGVDPLELKAGG